MSALLVPVREWREEALRDSLVEARLQIEYLHEKFQVTGTGNAALARIDAALSTSPSSERRTDAPDLLRWRGAFKAPEDEPADPDPIREEMERLRRALEEIRDDKTASYGVSELARAALSKHRDQSNET